MRYVEARFPRATVSAAPSLPPDGTTEPIRRKFARHMAVLRVQVHSVDELSELIARAVDRRRARAAGSLAMLDDDQQSDLDYEVEDVRTSDLDEDD